MDGMEETRTGTITGWMVEGSIVVVRRRSMQVCRYTLLG